MHQSTKSYGHDVGLSACFRQWRAASHCRFLHGYALAVSFKFEAQELDANGWVVDFGSLKTLKAVLQNHFDHKLVVAQDDPKLADFLEMESLGIAQVVVLHDGVGCEAFAKFIHGLTLLWLEANKYSPRVRLVSVEVREHGANSAIYLGA